jgi:hypothetical protein
MSNVLSKHNIKMVGFLLRKTAGFLQPINDDTAFSTLGIYNIPCKCGKVYTVQAGYSVETQCSLPPPKKSRCTDKVIKEVIMRSISI